VIPWDPPAGTVALDRAFSREEAAGYDRSIINDTSIVVVGAGAIGQFVMLCLALVGYPKVVCIDMDRFERSNASRSPFYREGWNKAKATTLECSRLCTAQSATDYRYSPCMIQIHGDAIFKHDNNVVVMSAVDNQLARLWLAQRSRKLGIILVEGGFFKERWNVSAFPNTKDTDPCWACGLRDLETSRVFSCDTYARATEVAGFVPATAPGAMGVAACQVGVMTQMLHGNMELANSTVSTDLQRGFAQKMRRTQDPDCQLEHQIVSDRALPIACGPNDTVDVLLTQLEGLLDAPIVNLPAAYVRVAPCIQCRHPAEIRQPEWAIHSGPRCTVCGGPYPRCADIPEQHGILSRSTCESIQSETLHSLGLGPGLHLDVEARTTRVTVTINGDLNLLVNTTPEVGEAHDDPRGVPTKTPRKGNEATSNTENSNEG
jgi:molybdopterin/thiamine biosynthesis adenylyltransferase